VGSQVIARRPDLDCSSATVRAVMADLEALGFLEKPHTSAGRIPTQLGYRFYVDALVRVREPRAAEKQMIERRTHDAASQGGPVDEVLRETTRLLHTLTRHAAVVISPRTEGERLARLELVRLREGRVLAVLVSRSGQVQNRLLVQQPGEPSLGQSQLDQAMNYLNSMLGDLTLVEARARLAAQLATEEAELGELKARALALGAAAVADDTAQSLVIEGQASFLEEPALVADVVKMRALFRALEEKKGIVQVLDRTLDAEELTIFIGADSGIAEPAEVSIIAAPYRRAGEVVGALGVIGPTRMDYSRVIPLVEFTARTMGSALDPTKG
jgi:heat-inducible transcriptional repressor